MRTQNKERKGENEIFQTIEIDINGQIRYPLALMT